MSNVFQRVKSNHPGKSLFDLSYEKKLTCDMGQLVPVMCDEMVPGDVFEVGNELVIRMQPLVAPILHEINAYIHYFFVPYRILWSDWEDFISGGTDGTFADPIPTWEPTDTAIGSLWDYLGFPTGVDPDGAYPIDFPRRAYARIYNEYYRDETLITEVAETNESILLRAWEKDYFTSSLPWQQRGTAPALPISGTSNVVWTTAPGVDGSGTLNHNASTNTNAALIGQNNGFRGDGTYATGTITLTTDLTQMNANSVDLSSASTFDIADLRLAFQVQRWLERNARAGARYTEFLTSHFGVAPRDERLQRPEYVGGSKSPIVISEVLQTESSDATTAQGTLAGHGITADRTRVGRYRATEFGLMMGIMSIMPRTLYQQGINRQWLKETKYDFYFPEFANLSEQAITQAEIYATGVAAENQTVFGYQGRYDEMRTKQNMVCADMRDTFDYWHLSRQFSSAPTLGKTFVECSPRKDIFAVPAVDGFIVNVANKIRAIRPMPMMSEPGLIDH